MTGTDRVAGVLCIAFAAAFQVGGELLTELVKQMQASAMTITYKGNITYNVIQPGLGTTATWSVILLVLGLGLIAKSIVSEVRQRRVSKSDETD